jgi:hypothetical protein
MIVCVSLLASNMVFSQSNFSVSETGTFAILLIGFIMIAVASSILQIVIQAIKSQDQSAQFFRSAPATEIVPQIK